MAHGFPDYEGFATPVDVPSGGTGAGSFTLNGAIYGRGTNVLGVTAAGAAGDVLRVPAGGGAPAFGNPPVLISDGNAPAVALLGDIDQAKWLLGLGAYDLSFLSDNADTGSTGNVSNITYGGRTYRPKVAFTETGQLLLAGAFDGARVYNSAAQTINVGAFQALTFDSERYDNGGLHSTVTNTSRLTAQKAGKYLITGLVEWASGSAGARQVAIRLNGITLICEESDYVPAAFGNGMNPATIYHLAAGDYVELMVAENSDLTLNVLASGNFSPEFAMEWLGP